MVKVTRIHLIEARKAHNLSQRELADHIGTTQNNVSRWELGITTPTSYFRTKLCDFFGKRPQDLDLLSEQEVEEEHDQNSHRSAPPPPADDQDLPIWHVPYSRNPFFTGRDSILELLHVLLKQQHTPSNRSYALCGLAGSGKTQTALEYVYRHSSAYTAIFWIDVEKYESFLSSLVSIAEVLDLPERHEQDQHKVVRAFTNWLGEHQTWLLICDNVEDLALLQPVLPLVHQGSLLLTTRLQAIGTIAQPLTLEPFSDQEGVIFLLQRARLLRPNMSLMDIAPDEIQATQTIVKEMKGLPLALDQAGAYIEATQCSAKEYLQLFRSSPLRILKERDNYLDHPLSIVRTFILIFKQLEQNNILAAEMLIICAYLSAEAIPEEIFIEGAMHLGPMFEKMMLDPLQFNTAIKTLLMYSLIYRNAATHVLAVHRLVQILLKEHLSPPLRHSWKVRVTRAITHFFPASEMEQAGHWQICERFLPHALSCITEDELSSANIAEQITLMKRVATYLRIRARYSEAEGLFKRVLEHLSNLEPPQVIDVLQELAYLYIIQRRHAQAEPLLRQALYLGEQTLDPMHPLKAEVLYKMGMISYYRRKYTEAENLYTQALHIWEQALGSENPQIGMVLDALAAICQQQGKYTEAELLFQRALYIKERLLGTEHPQVAASLNDLAAIYIRQKKYKQAELLSQRVLRIWKQALGPKHPSLAYPLANLAESAAEQEKHEEAKILYEHALGLWEQKFGPEHPKAVPLLQALATLYTKQKKYDVAKLFYERALTIQEKALGLDHPDILETQIKYRALLQTMNQGEENQAVSGGGA